TVPTYPELKFKTKLELTYDLLSLACPRAHLAARFHPSRRPSVSAGREEDPPRHRDQRPQNGRQLLLAAREIQPRGPRLSRSRKRLQRCGDEAHRAFSEEALRRDAEPGERNRRRGSL